MRDFSLRCFKFHIMPENYGSFEKHPKVYKDLPGDLPGPLIYGVCRETGPSPVNFAYSWRLPYYRNITKHVNNADKIYAS